MANTQRMMDELLLKKTQEHLQKAGFEKYLAYLVERWEDEKDYEDWNDYVMRIDEFLNKLGLKADQVSSDPLEVIFYIEKRRYTYTTMVTSQYIRFSLALDVD